MNWHYLIELFREFWGTQYTHTHTGFPGQGCHAVCEKSARLIYNGFLVSSKESAFSSIKYFGNALKITNVKMDANYAAKAVARRLMMM
jgi:hypothetical protein